MSVVRTAAEVTLAREVRTAEGIEKRSSSSASRRAGSPAWSTRCSCCRAPKPTECRFAASFWNLDDLLAESARALRVLANQRAVTVMTNGDQEVGVTGDDALLRR